MRCIASCYVASALIVKVDHVGVSTIAVMGISLGNGLLDYAATRTRYCSRCPSSCWPGSGWTPRPRCQLPRRSCRAQWPLRRTCSSSGSHGRCSGGRPPGAGLVPGNCQEERCFDMSGARRCHHTGSSMLPELIRSAQHPWRQAVTSSDRMPSPAPHSHPWKAEVFDSASALLPQLLPLSIEMLSEQALDSAGGASLVSRSPGPRQPHALSEALMTVLLLKVDARLPAVLLVQRVLPGTHAVQLGGGCVHCRRRVPVA